LKLKPISTYQQTNLETFISSKISSYDPIIRKLCYKLISYLSKNEQILSQGLTDPDSRVRKVLL